MDIHVKCLLFVSLAMLPLRAQEAPSVIVENLELDRQKELISFDVVNRSTKVVRGWMATINSTREKDHLPPLKATGFFSSVNCSREAALTPPGASCRCKTGVGYGDVDASLLTVDVQVTATLFEDGTTEGDREQLEALSQKAHDGYTVQSHWLKEFQRIGRGGTPVGQLESFTKLLSSIDSAAPPGLELNGDLFQDWRRTHQFVAEAMDRVQKGAPADAEVTTVEKWLEDQAGAWKRTSDAFPWRGKTSTENGPALEPAPQVENRALQLRILRTELRPLGVSLYVRNDYAQEIAGYELAWSGESTFSARQSGGAALLPGETDRLEMGPPPRPDGLRPEPMPQILCVVFKDRTGDGDVDRIQELNKAWAGRLTARALFAAPLHELTVLPDAELPAAIEKVSAAMQKQAAMSGPDAEPKQVDGEESECLWMRSMLLGFLRQSPALPPARLKQLVTSFVEKLDRQ
jgi:hypothetical protein